MIREDDSDLVFRNEGSKFNALIDEIVEMQEQGRPVLVGTVTVEKSEVLSTMLKRRGIKHETLNAKFHEKESGIIAQAGRTGAVTIATNMAGRGTDIMLGGNPAGLASEILHKRGLNPAEVDKATYDAALAEAKLVTDEDHERVVAVGGLHIIGTERHDSRRIDNQLRGRAGRQGDPGSSRFYLSLEDDLMKRFASDRVAGLMERLGLEDDVAIESRIVSKTIESAQSRVEGFNFDMRKRVVEFDDVINRQRETIYAERDKVLRNEDLSETVRAFVEDEIHAIVDCHLTGENVDDWGMEGLAAAPPGDGHATAPARPRTSSGSSGSRDVILEHLLELADARLEAREQGGRRGRLGDRRAARPRPDDRLALGRAPHRDRRHAARASASAATPSRTRSTSSGGRRSSSTRSCASLIRHQVATSIFRVTVTRQRPAHEPAPSPPDRARQAVRDLRDVGSATATATGPATGARRPRRVRRLRGSPDRRAGSPRIPMARALRGRRAAGAPAPGEAKPGFTPTGARIGRNDACWCGSGQKYKKCHGR